MLLMLNICYKLQVACCKSKLQDICGLQLLFALTEFVWHNMQQFINPFWFCIYKYRLVNAKFLIILFFIIFTCLKNNIKAQQLPVTNQYLVNKYSLSPAYAGYNGRSEIFIGFRRQWAGITGTPKTSFANFTTPLSDKAWLGGSIISDQTDIFKNFYVSLSYTYQLQITANQFIGFSLWGSVRQNTINLLNINVPDPDDPLIANKQKLVGTGFNAGASILYRTKHFDMGIVIPFLFLNKNKYGVGSENNLMIIERELFVHASYRFMLNEDWQIQPIFVFRSTKNNISCFDISSLVKYLNKYWLGLTYRNTSIMGLSAGGEILEGLVLNYTYEFSVGGYTNYFSGTNEISLGYIFNIQQKSKRNKRSTPYPSFINYDYRYFQKK
jgi:type IX secretion system PorP/SprF family membrane protein